MKLHRQLKRVLSQDARLSLEILPLVASVRWHLWRTPFSRLHPYWRARVQEALDGNCGRIGETPTKTTIEDVWQCAHAVKRAARLVPFASCLTQAMTLQLMLAQRGQPCSVCIGVGKSRTPQGVGAPTTQESATYAEVGVQNSPDDDKASPLRFQAHAWVVWNDRVVMGGDIRRWKPLTIFAPIVPSVTAGDSERAPSPSSAGSSHHSEPVPTSIAAPSA